MDWLKDRKKIEKIEEIVLCLLGFSLFMGYNFVKILIPIIIILLFLRKKIFKEKLCCGNEKIKKYILLYIFIGMIWNLFGGMTYKTVRSFIKISRYIPILFFLYPLFKKNIKYLKEFLFCSFISFILLFFIIIKQYTNGVYRVPGIEGINPTGTMGAIVASFSFGLFLEKKKTLEKIGYLLIFILGSFIPIATKGRAPFIGLILSILVMSLLDIYKKRNIKKILITLVSLVVALTLIVKIVPNNKFDRFKNIFNTEETIANGSNGIRIELWKNAIWRFKQKPIFGSGTKNDDGLFQEYVKNMPDQTKIEKQYKNIIATGGFNDAHNMYLNNMTDNGIFSIMTFGLWFGIPGYLFILKFKKNKGELLIGSIGGIIVYLVVGCFWMLWRMPEQLYFWILFTIFLHDINKTKENKNI